MALGIVNVETNKTEYLAFLSDVSNVQLTGSDGQISIKWTDPADVSFEGTTLSKWAGTIVVRKEGSAPTSKLDGTQIVKSTTRDQYKSTPFVDSNVTNGTTYFYRFFPYTKESFTSGSSFQARASATLITIPSITSDTSSYVYNETTTYTPTISYDTSNSSISGQTSGKDAGTYTITATLTNNSAIWSDGTIADKSLTFSVQKANGSIAVETSTMNLSSESKAGSVSYTALGDGEVTVSYTATHISASVDQTNKKINVVNINSDTGTGTIIVNIAEGSNYKAASTSFNVKVGNYKVMTVTIDESNSNPATCCAYYDDAVGMSPGSDEWDEFFGYYPVLFKDGEEVVKLDPNDFSKDIDGNAVDITTGNAGDVMIAFPRRGLTMFKFGNIITIRMTDDPDDSDFKYYAHQRGNTPKDVFYIGAYKGCEVNNKLRSLSGKTPTVNKIISAFRTLARNNSPASDGNGGSGYDQSGWFQLIFRQCMYVLKYKNLNSQAAVGMGWVSQSTDSPTTTGNTNQKGMNWGESTGKFQMKLFGVEDMWGNIWEWVDGLVTDANRHALTATESFNDGGTGYTDQGLAADSDLVYWNYITKTSGSSEKGFLLTSYVGSASTYYCDYGVLSASRIAESGGQGNYGSGIGAFSVALWSSASGAYSIIGARLMFC